MNPVYELSAELTLESGAYEAALQAAEERARRAGEAMAASLRAAQQQIDACTAAVNRLAAALGSLPTGWISEIREVM